MRHYFWSPRKSLVGIASSPAGHTDNGAMTRPGMPYRRGGSSCLAVALLTETNDNEECEWQIITHQQKGRKYMWKIQKKHDLQGVGVTGSRHEGRGGLAALPYETVRVWGNIHYNELEPQSATRSERWTWKSNAAATKEYWHAVYHGGGRGGMTTLLGLAGPHVAPQRRHNTRSNAMKYINK